MPRRKREPLAKFRIYGWRSVLFYHVYIWETLKDLRAEYDSNRRNKDSSRGVEGFCRPIRTYRVYENGKHKITPKAGEIHLAAKYLTTERITHECTHATIKIFNRLNIDFKCLDYGDAKSDVLIERWLSGEEMFCYMVGHFSKQVVDRIYKLEFLVEAKNGHKNKSVRRASRRRKDK